MRVTRLLSVSAVAFAVLCSTASAQSLRNAKGPANLPPASFKGPQFVDNRGCVFIRAGSGGRVTWVPRVARSRKQLCGLQPTFGTTKVATATRTPRVAKPATTTRVVRAPKKTTRVVQAPKKTTRIVRKVRAPQQKVPNRTSVTTQKCRVSSLSAKYMNRAGARCGPQQVSPTGVVRQSGQKSSQLTGPKGVNRRIVEARMPVPGGYAAVWNDGRLNPLRGVGTISGKSQMSLVWSQTVPRYLIDATTGKPATRRQIRLFGG